MKFIFLILSLLFCTFARAGEMVYCPPDSQKCEKIFFDDKWSFKDFTGRIFTEDFIPTGTVIVGTSFSHEVPNTQVFHGKVREITFIRCNLDNVAIPEGSTVIESSTRKFKVQADGEDWVLGDDEKPTEPIRKEEFIRLGKSIRASDIQEKSK